MSPPLEPHDYIGLSAAAAPPTPTSSSSSSSSPAPRLTLRLGLPGSESPDRDRPRRGRRRRALPRAPVRHPQGRRRRHLQARLPRLPQLRRGRQGRRGQGASRGAAGRQVRPTTFDSRKGGFFGPKPDAAGLIDRCLQGAAEDGASGGGPLYVKVSMDGAPYLRKVDLKMYSSYEDLSMALEKMFSCFITGQGGLRKSSNKERLTNGSKVDALQDKEYVLTYEIRMPTGCLLAIFLGFVYHDLPKIENYERV
ncbi:hypothetical protein EJB05_17445, partial [Eragrostis curvula]